MTIPFNREQFFEVFAKATNLLFWPVAVGYGCLRAGLSSPAARSHRNRLIIVLAVAMGLVGMASSRRFFRFQRHETTPETAVLPPTRLASPNADCRSLAGSYRMRTSKAHVAVPSAPLALSVGDWSPDIAEVSAPDTSPAGQPGSPSIQTGSSPGGCGRERRLR